MAVMGFVAAGGARSTLIGVVSGSTSRLLHDITLTGEVRRREWSSCRFLLVAPISTGSGNRGGEVTDKTARSGGIPPTTRTPTLAAIEALVAVFGVADGSSTRSCQTRFSMWIDGVTGISTRA